MSLEEILWKDFLRNYPKQDKQELMLSDYLLVIQYIFQNVNDEYSADSIDFFMSEVEGLLDEWRKELD